MENLNILVDARPLIDPNSGGVKRVAISTLEDVLKRAENMHFTFVTTGARKETLPAPFCDHDLVEHIHIPWPNKAWSLLALFGATSLDREVSRITKKKYHAAIFPNIGFTGFIEIPYALIMHDLSFLIEPAWFTPNMQLWHRMVNVKELARRANRIFAVSETTSRDAIRLLNVPEDKVEVFRPSIPVLPSTIPDARYPIPGRYILAIGENDPRKNIGTVIEAFKAIYTNSEFSDVTLVLVGGRARDKQDGILRLGSVTDDELAGLYEHATAFLYPTWYEGFGLPLHEAATYGTPSLASAHGAIPETAPEGTLLIPPAKPQLWRSALEDVLRHPDLYRTRALEASGDDGAKGITEWLHHIRNT